jgi:hypothetical protein
MLTENSAKTHFSLQKIYYIGVLIYIQYGLVAELKLKGQRKGEIEVIRKYQLTLEASWPKFQTMDLVNKQESEEHLWLVNKSQWTKLNYSDVIKNKALLKVSIKFEIEPCLNRLWI